MFTQLLNHQRECLETSTGGSRIKIHVFNRDLQNTNQELQIKQSMQIWLTVIAWQGFSFLSVEVEQNCKGTIGSWITLCPPQLCSWARTRAKAGCSQNWNHPLGDYFLPEPQPGPTLLHSMAHFAPCSVAGTVQLAGPPASSTGLQPLASRWALLAPRRGKENAQLLWTRCLALKWMKFR